MCPFHVLNSSDSFHNKQYPSKSGYANGAGSPMKNICFLKYKFINKLY